MMSSHFQEVILFTTSTKPTQQCRRTVTTGGLRLMQVQEKSCLGKLYCTRTLGLDFAKTQISWKNMVLINEKTL